MPRHFLRYTNGRTKHRRRGAESRKPRQCDAKLNNYNTESMEFRQGPDSLFNWHHWNDHGTEIKILLIFSPFQNLLLVQLFMNTQHYDALRAPLPLVSALDIKCKHTTSIRMKN